MVEMVLPLGSNNKTFVDPRLGYKIPSARQELKAKVHRNKILFRPNVQILGHASSSNENHHPRYLETEIRMYNFTEFEDDKSKHNKVMPQATPHVTKSEETIIMRNDNEGDEKNQTVDEDVKILFDNLDPDPEMIVNRGYMVDNSKIIIQSRTKRGVSGSPGSTENVANYDKFCGGTFRGLSGVIKSPNYPLYYPNRKHCVYDIEVPDGYDYTIKFRCDDFGVQGTQVFCHCIYNRKNVM